MRVDRTVEYVKEKEKKRTYEEVNRKEGTSDATITFVDNITL